MINESKLQYLCNKYNIKYQFFESTNVILLNTGLDIWKIKYFPHKNKPFCLLHKNKIRQTNKFHIQRWLTTLYQSLDVVVNHKNWLKPLYDSQHKYKHKQNKNIIDKINKIRRTKDYTKLHNNFKIY